MALVHKSIEQLDLDSKFLWLLDFFGGFVVNPADEPQESVECILTPCSPHPQFPGRMQRHLSRQEVRTVGVNSLGLLQLGHCLQDGVFVPSSISSKLEEIEFQFDSRNLPESHELYLNQVGIDPSSSLISDRLLNEGVHSAVKVIDGEILKTSLKTTPEKDASPHKPYPFKVLFHELEIMRFYYTNSANLNGAVFGGHFSEDFLYRKVVSNLHEGPHCELTSKAARFEYQVDFSFDDAILIGRILFEDPSSALEGVRRIHLSKLVARANEVSPRLTGYPRTKFPFKQKAVIKIRGRRIKLLDNKFIFVAHRIEECNAKFPFDDLTFQRVAEPGGSTPPPGAPEAYANQQSQTGPGQHQGVIDTEARPAKNSVAATAVPEIRRFTSLELSRCMTRKARPSTHSSAEKKPPVFNPRLENSSAGTPTWGNSTAVRQDVSDKIVGTEVNEEPLEDDLDEPEVAKRSIDLESFKRILDHLESKFGIDSIQPMPIPMIQTVAGKISTGDDLYSFFPVIPCLKQRSRNRQFSFLDKAQKERRKLICVSLRAGERLFYVLEAERRINEQNIYMEDFPILLLWANDFGAVEVGKLREILIRTVRNPSKTWPLDISFLDLKQKRIDHDSVRTTDVIAGRIIQAIEST
ncbi:hypothetical protein FSY45_20010 [Comamonas sp. Z1]|uniref:hypothetical protein n=1 Tax=Comamonas sp. Z1 TaxID=2601246 RepID=UPI000EE5A312|nr:hypothetical protein [Comamonas sp. Z1]RIK94010.1 MAG: hypothetical protein DCC73_05405 [Pseudomonadota bacterium]TYK74126.1 hypothetical protein FSY45_20010 [Comamonas sp. Z1]